MARRPRHGHKFAHTPWAHVWRYIVYGMYNMVIHLESVFRAIMCRTNAIRARDKPHFGSRFLRTATHLKKHTHTHKQIHSLSTHTHTHNYYRSLQLAANERSNSLDYHDPIIRFWRGYIPNRTTRLTHTYTHRSRVITRRAYRRWIYDCKHRQTHRQSPKGMYAVCVFECSSGLFIDSL